MKGAARVGDSGGIHSPCWPIHNTAEGSPNVMINGRPAHAQGHAWVPHCRTCKTKKCHGSVLAAGSPTVFTNGRQQGRQQDPVSCGGVVLTGSSDVMVGPG